MGILLNNSYVGKKWPPVSNTSEEGESGSTSDVQPIGRKITTSSEGVYYTKPNDNSYEKWYKEVYPGSAKNLYFNYTADKDEPPVYIKHENGKNVINLNMPKGQFITHKSVLTTVLRDKYNNQYNTWMANNYVKAFNTYSEKYQNGQFNTSNPLEAHRYYLFLTNPDKVGNMAARNNKQILDGIINNSSNYANYFDNDKTKLAYKLYYDPEVRKEAQEEWNKFRKKLPDKTYSYYDYFSKNYLPSKLASMEESGNYPDEYTKKTVYNILGRRQ